MRRHPFKRQSGGVLSIDTSAKDQAGKTLGEWGDREWPAVQGAHL